MAELTERKCSHCKVVKPITEFVVNKSQATGYSYYCVLCNRLIVRKWRKEHPDKVRATQRKVHQRRWNDPVLKKKILEQNAEYRKNNWDSIRDKQRQTSRKRLGLPNTPKTFSFYRDVIKEWMKEPSDVSNPKWQQLLSLNLTNYQREIVHLTMQGMTLVAIAKEMKKQQSSITKVWGGGGEINKGGIIAKVRKHLPHLLGEYK